MGSNSSINGIESFTEYRLPIELYYSGNLSVHEMAIILHLPENTVKSRLLRGRQLLKKELEALGYDG